MATEIAATTCLSFSGNQDPSDYGKDLMANCMKL